LISHRYRTMAFSVCCYDSPIDRLETCSPAKTFCANSQAGSLTDQIPMEKTAAGISAVDGLEGAGSPPLSLSSKITSLR
jgi:hypothetical protein